jgi:hypothetical protein
MSVQAGMTVYGLRDIYALRLQEISFFVVLFFASAFGFKALWNYAFKDLRIVPRLRYRHALSAALVFGLLMLLILTMISGIREVLTPGAWRRQGSSYRLTDPAQEPVRRRSLEHLRSALLGHARTHDGQFPAHDFGNELPDKLWESPDPFGTRYIYFGGLSTNGSPRLLALEPPNLGDRRYALKTTGEIELLSNDEIQRMMRSQQ